jgi:hypothetical protein
MEVVTCEHCEEKMNVLPTRQPVVYVEPEEEGVRSFVIIGADDWLLYRCVIPHMLGQ